MAVFCIPKHLVSKLKESALKGEIDITRLYDMSSKERREFFTKFTDKETGKFLNTEFEKAMISEQKNALTDWVKGVFTPEAKSKPVFKNILDKINSLDELGVLTPKSEKAFLEDLVSDKLGISITPQETKAISEKAIKIQQAQEKLGNNLGDPNFIQENIDFFKAKSEMDDYLLSLNPAHNLKVLTGTTGRGAMLASVKSPVLNIGSNTEVGIVEALSRRLSEGSLKTTDNKLAMDYVKMVNKVYQQSGYDISRMTSLADTGVSGQRVLGDIVHAEGPGLNRKVGRFFEDVVFKQLMGAPDVAFSSVHFADSVNLQAMKAAKGNKTVARDLMLDAMRIQPQTEAGELLRAQAILDAQYATYTNKSAASKFSEGIRKILNDLSGDTRLGDFVMPFVKTPANVIAAGLDYGGAGTVKAFAKLVKAIGTKQPLDKAFIRGVSRDLIRSGLGFTAALAITNQVKDDDFVGAYDPSRTQIEALRNSNSNSIRINGKWISVDWFGPMGVPISAIMYARKYGTSKAEKAFQYVKGAGETIKQLPGIDTIANFMDTTETKGKTLSQMTQAAGKYAIDQLSARLIPSIIADVAKMTDTYQRKTTNAVEAVKAKIPGLRQTLPIKKNIFGEDLYDEGAITNLMFGSRVKTSTETALVKEINRVATEAQKSVSFTDWNKSSTAELNQFKQTVGEEKFKQAVVDYGQELSKRLQKIVDSAEYQNASEDDKLKLINGADTYAKKEVFRKYNFKYKAAPKSKTIKIK